MDSALRPRDIQARVRAGQSPEVVAAAAQTTVEKIMVFAAPVLAERAHVAAQAQRASVRRRAGDGPSGVLGELVADRLSGRDVDPGAVEWDAWRRGDGRWTLVADYRLGDSGRHAEFAYDASGRYVVTENDEARWLAGEQGGRSGPHSRPGQAGGAWSRLTAVEDAEQLPLGADAIDLVTERRADPSRLVPAGTEADEEVRPVSAEPSSPSQDADPPAAKKPGRRSRGRASVPSWDEIMFGGKSS